LFLIGENLSFEPSKLLRLSNGLRLSSLRSWANGKRERIPEILETEEMQKLLAALGIRERAMVFLDMPSGLRRGELAGLKWGDFDFKNLHAVTPYKQPSDYVWATAANRAGAKRGKQPVWLSAVMRDIIQPAARKPGITKKNSWHTFATPSLPSSKRMVRTSKVVQELFRHNTSRMTLDTYTQALSPDKRAAQGKVVSMIGPKPSCTVVVPRNSEEIRANG